MGAAMKISTLALGLSVALTVGAALAAGAAQGPRAKLVGQRVLTSYPGSPILICRYFTPQASYEVVAASASCAPYLVLEQDPARDTFAAVSSDPAASHR
jgi:curli biogenesis system outer membrane secretion channel CsgG